MNIWLVTTYSTDFDLNFIPHHLDHYLNLGIHPRNFLIVLHNRIHPVKLEFASNYLFSRGFSFQVWRDEWHTIPKIKLNYKQMIDNCQEGDWILHAEADEFHHYTKPFRYLINDCEENGYDGVYGVFVDRLTPDGTLKEVDPGQPLDEQFPIKCFSNRVWNANPNLKTNFKVMLYRAGLVPNSGIHSLRGDVKYHPETQQVHHFRWNSTTYEKYERRAKFVDNAYNSRKIINYLRNNDGKVNLKDVTMIDSTKHFLSQLF